MIYNLKIVCSFIAFFYHFAWIGGPYQPLFQQDSGGVVSPVSDNTSIRMDSEKVEIRLEQDSFSVDAEFIFYNTGETVTKLVGFPQANYVTVREYKRPTNYMGLETWINGKKAKITNRGPDSKPMTGAEFYDKCRKGTIKKGARFPSREIKLWLVCSVTFPGHAFTKMRTKYQSRYFVTMFGQVRARYIVGTGRHWKDRIGRAVFIIDPSGVGGQKNVKIGIQKAPGPWLNSGGVLIREITNFEPEPREALSVRLLRTKEINPL